MSLFRVRTSIYPWWRGSSFTSETSVSFLLSSSSEGKLYPVVFEHLCVVFADKKTLGGPGRLAGCALCQVLGCVLSSAGPVTTTLMMLRISAVHAGAV